MTVTILCACGCGTKLGTATFPDGSRPNLSGYWLTVHAGRRVLTREEKLGTLGYSERQARLLLATASDPVAGAGAFLEAEKARIREALL